MLSAKLYALSALNLASIALLLPVPAKSNACLATGSTASILACNLSIAAKADLVTLSNSLCKLLSNLPNPIMSMSCRFNLLSTAPNLLSVARAKSCIPSLASLFNSEILLNISDTC